MQQVSALPGRGDNSTWLLWRQTIAPAGMASTYFKGVGLCPLLHAPDGGGGWIGAAGYVTSREKQRRNRPPHSSSFVAYKKGEWPWRSMDGQGNAPPMAEAKLNLHFWLFSAVSSLFSSLIFPFSLPLSWELPSRTRVNTSWKLAPGCKTIALVPFALKRSQK
ncbi:hypothetical protein SRHO_G00093450 [Serrasalmus rhombeus]